MFITKLSTTTTIKGFDEIPYHMDGFQKIELYFLFREFCGYMTTPAEFLRKLTPTRRILSIVGRNTGNNNPLSIGFAVSDPYYSHATPIFTTLSNTDSIPKLVQNIAKEYDAEAILVATVCRNALAAYSVANDKVQDDFYNQLVRTQQGNFQIIKNVSSKHKSLEDVIAESKINLLWEQIPVTDLLLEALDDRKQNKAEDLTRNCSIHAAVALQMWLDEHCGGWANTFG